MLLRTTVRLAIPVLAILLVGISTLADLRSPEGTATLGTALAEDQAVRTLVSTTLVDALLEDARTTAPGAAALLPLARPILESAVRTALDSPAGRDALAQALTDVTRQLTFAGPIVLDLRPAITAAAAALPEPLGTLARAAIGRGTVGVLVLGRTPSGAAPVVPSADELARVGGWRGTTVATLVGLLLVAAVVVSVAVAGGDRAARLRGAGTSLLLVGAPSTLVLRLAPERITDVLIARTTAVLGGGADDAAGADGAELLAAILPTLADAVSALLSRTTLLTLAMAVVGVLLVVAGRLQRRG